MPWALAFVVGSMVTPLVVRRIRPAFVMAGGLADRRDRVRDVHARRCVDRLRLFAGGTTLFALGFAPVFTLTTDLIVGSAPPERAGAASAMSETSAEFGGALGIAIFGSIGVAIYRDMIGDGPAGVSARGAGVRQGDAGGRASARRAISPTRWARR